MPTEGKPANKHPPRMITSGFAAVLVFGEAVHESRVTSVQEGAGSASSSLRRSAGSVVLKWAGAVPGSESQARLLTVPGSSPRIVVTAPAGWLSGSYHVSRIPAFE